MCVCVCVCVYVRAVTRVTLQRMNVKEALQAICVFAGVTLVEAINFTATFYGRSLHGGHVCLLVKAARDSMDLSIDAKCTSQALTDAVLAALVDNLK